ncbi:hypothetical protein CRENBAI_023949 [Crenichthys baileyi]|uniref:Uncharacterized protein n=1 Tax=Crenichthys baileyi TaxID=28760 RepID=A0AAV9QWM5_9TELE
MLRKRCPGRRSLKKRPKPTSGKENRLTRVVETASLLVTCLEHRVRLQGLERESSQASKRLQRAVSAPCPMVNRLGEVKERGKISLQRQLIPSLKRQAGKQELRQEALHPTCHRRQQQHESAATALPENISSKRQLDRIPLNLACQLETDNSSAGAGRTYEMYPLFPPLISICLHFWSFTFTNSKTSLLLPLSSPVCLPTHLPQTLHLDQNTRLQS